MELAAGQAGAAFADEGGVALGEADDVVVNVGGLRGGFDDGVGGAGAAVADVVLDGRISREV